MKRNYIVALILLLLVGGISLLLRPSSIPPVEVDFSGIPMVIGEWKGENIPISEEVAAYYKGEALLERSYRNPRGEPLGLTISYSPKRRRESAVYGHSPRRCYPAGGWTITSKRVEEIKLAEGTLKINSWLVEKGIRKQVVLFWFAPKGHTTPSEFVYTYFAILEQFKRRPGGASLTQVAVPVIYNEEEAVRKGKEFVRELYPFLSSYLKTLYH